MFSYSLISFMLECPPPRAPNAFFDAKKLEMLAFSLTSAVGHLKFFGRLLFVYPKQKR
jgi:hypothetical protein